MDDGLSLATKVAIVARYSVLSEPLEACIHAWRKDLPLSVFHEGRAALNWLAKTNATPVFAMVDLDISDMDGNDLVSTLREQYPSLPVMLVSLVETKTGKTSSVTYQAKCLSEDRFPKRINTAPIVSRKVLTSREIETLRHISKGYTYEQTAHAMNISLSTIQSHIRNTYRKLGARNQMQATAKALSLGLI